MLCRAWSTAAQLLRQYDLLAVPSRTFETGPLVVLEAFAAGVPVIGSNLGGVNELVRHEVNGLLVEPPALSGWVSALRRCVEEPDLLPRLPREFGHPERRTKSRGKCRTCTTRLADPMRILFLQFTNPAGYPPLLHSSRLLATNGWEVLFLGIRSQGTACLRIPPHPGIQTRQMDLCPAGWRQKVQYLRFAASALWCSARWRPDWIYASDPLSCPVALLLSRLPGIRVLYHEHDAPLERSIPASVLRARRRLAHQAQLCVLPNQERLKQFQDATGTRPSSPGGLELCGSRRRLASGGQKV